ncbi:MAG: heavy-metal-associated domain-containing protein [Actinobacteria bacterium]|nr:heavy-metal-associated domain-containing protein [Actinomycetota bacterium]MBI3687617.1 heavy-metal-associated domain-containing protein [Actinomycetota bacterium]
MNSRRYTVTGMTCGHCVSSVTEEVSTVPGVASVDVDLASGAMVVTGEAWDDLEVLAAVEEAGYAADPVGA